jgi:hypothetical protein
VINKKERRKFEKRISKFFNMWILAFCFVCNHTWMFPFLLNLRYSKKTMLNPYLNAIGSLWPTRTTLPGINNNFFSLYSFLTIHCWTSLTLFIDQSYQLIILQMPHSWLFLQQSPSWSHTRIKRCFLSVTQDSWTWLLKIL